MQNKETLKEAALKWFMTANKREIIFDLGWIKIFEAGAKWQAGKSYSEEDIEKAFYAGLRKAYSPKKHSECWKEWFEQFKKK
jgi:hypothetical protein